MDSDSRLFLVAWRGRQVVIREFDPAAHPTQARAAHGNFTRPEAWALANRRAASCPKHYDPLQRKARDIVFVGLDGETRTIKTAEAAIRKDAPKHHYTVTLKIRRTGEERVTQEQGSNKKEAIDAARARIEAATTLVSYTKGERVEQAPQPVAQTTTTPASAKMPWE